jgi:hypothetical protein
VVGRTVVLAPEGAVPQPGGRTVIRPQMLLGSVLVAIGAVFLLDAFDMVQAGTIIGSWWPLVIVGIGAARLLSRPPDVLGGLVTGGIGLVVLGFTTDVLDGSVIGMVWPLALVVAGAYLLFTRSGSGPRGATDEDSVSAFVLFSGREMAPMSQDFHGGSLVAIFGGVEIDLRHAALAPGAHLDVTAIFGGAEVTVPPGWRVRVTGPGIFGGTENGAERQQLPVDAPTLDVRALALFGGVEVKLAPAPVAPRA